MRGADLWFAQEMTRSSTSHRVIPSIVTSARTSARLHAVLSEMGIDFTTSGPMDPAFGKELPTRFLHVRGFSRTWCIDRLPGAELEPGWLFRLLPPGLDVALSWHATPLPAAWIVHYLQRQLISMRASRLQDTIDPTLAGALPTAEDLQRRLTSSQDKAFHVATYVTLTSPNRVDLELDSSRIEAA